MTIEITIRLEDPRRDQDALWESIVCEFDIAASHEGHLVGGFFFRTEREPGDFFMFLQEQGHEMADFENIEIKPAA